MAAAAPGAVDGGYWLWSGGAERAACLELAQRLGCGATAGPLPASAPVEALAGAQATPAPFPEALAAGAEWVGSTVLCAETEEFRQLARALPRKGWFCVDIGAAHGHATECLAAACSDGGAEGGRVVGVEKGHEFYAAARSERPQLEFQKLDALAAPQYLLQLAAGADCVIVDINGVRELEALTPLLALVQRAIRPSLILCKSRKLHESAARWAAAERGVDAGQPPGKRSRATATAEQSETARAPVGEVHCGGRCVALRIDGVRGTLYFICI